MIPNRIVPKRIVPAMLAALLLFFLGAADGMGKGFPRQLEDIKMFGKGETIEFVFSQPYQGTPAVEHGKGVFSLSFSGTGSAKPVRNLRPVEESLFKDIKVVQNRYSTTVSFRLKDPAVSLRGKLAFTNNQKILLVRLNGGLPVVARATPAIPADPPKALQDQKLLRQMEKRIAGRDTAGDGESPAGRESAPTQNATLTFGELAGDNFFSSLVSMVIALVIIVGALYGALYLYNRYFAGRLRRFTGSHAIRQVASFHIGPRQRIVLLDMNGEVIACGITPSQITYITHLGGKGAAGLSAESLLAGKAGDGDAPPGMGLKDSATSPESNPAKNDPVHQFAEVLKQKVRSLKRIN